MLICNNILIILVFCVVLHGSTVLAKTVCYPPYGCFSNEKPFNNARFAKWLLLPNSPSKQDLQFWLYTSDNVNEQRIMPIPESATSIRDSRVIPDVPTYFIIHGFQDTGRSAWVQDLKNQLLLKLEPKNVIIVHWEKGAANLVKYFKAVANTRVVGAVTGRLIVDLNREKNIEFEDVHLMGHSLGAHTSGYAGKTVQRISDCGDAVGRITGLDPAGLGFASYDTRVKLDRSDADFVDAIHTNLGTLSSGAFGYQEGLNIGHVDFVVNGGRKQPGCDRFAIICSHHRAHDLFANSIRKCRFPVKNCRTGTVQRYDEMGYATKTSLRGRLCVETTDKEPFCHTKLQSDLMADPVSRLLGLYSSTDSDQSDLPYHQSSKRK